MKLTHSISKSRAAHHNLDLQVREMLEIGHSRFSYIHSTYQSFIHLQSLWRCHVGEKNATFLAKISYHYHLLSHFGPWTKRLKFKLQVIQSVTLLSPNVGGHPQPLRVTQSSQKGHKELPGLWFSFISKNERKVALLDWMRLCMEDILHLAYIKPCIQTTYQLVQDFFNQQDHLRRRKFPQSHFTVHVLRSPNCRRLPMYFPVMLPQKGPKDSPTKNLHFSGPFSVGWHEINSHETQRGIQGIRMYKSYTGLPYETNTSGFYELICHLRLPMTWKILDKNHHITFVTWKTTWTDKIIHPHSYSKYSNLATLEALWIRVGGIVEYLLVMKPSVLGCPRKLVNG